MTKTYFVTGTDTEVGKTVASCALLQAAGKQGWKTVGYKPVASGSERTGEGYVIAMRYYYKLIARLNYPMR